MILITGPLFSGKRQFVSDTFGYPQNDFTDNPNNEKRVVYNAHLLVEGLTTEKLQILADTLAKKDIVILDEVGGGIVPIDEKQRYNRENAGLLGQLLAKRASTVVRVWCGLPLILKGSLPSINGE